MSDHGYGPHSNEQDFTLLYTQAQLDAMVARERAMERERCAVVAEAVLEKGVIEKDVFYRGYEAGRNYAGGEIAARIREGK